jgi:hypothetical protein
MQKLIFKNTSCCNKQHYSTKYFKSEIISVILAWSKSTREYLMMRVTIPGQKIKRPCPDCGGPLIKRGSRLMSPLVSRTIIVCKNIVCGATFTGFDEITHRLSPPSNPNPELMIPMSPHAVRVEVLNSTGLALDETTDDE